MRNISQRELRNDISRVLREVEAGEQLRVTVNGRPVADLVPVEGLRRTFVPRDALVELLEKASLGHGFLQDVEPATGATIDEL